MLENFPGENSTDVPVNSGVEIRFNREGFLNWQEAYKIEPAVEGKIEAEGDLIRFIPKSLKPRTIYTVSVKENLGLQDSEEKLAQAHIFSFETGDKEDLSSRPMPYFSFFDDFVDALPGKNPVISVSHSNINAGEHDMKIYKFDNLDEFRKSYLGSKNWNNYWSNFNNIKQDIAVEGKKPIVTFKPVIKGDDFQGYVELPQKLEEGYYLLEYDYGSNKEFTHLQIVSWAHYYSVNHENGIFWAYDFGERIPVEGASLKFYGETGEKGLGISDANGLFEFLTPDELHPVQEADKGNAPYFFSLEKEGYLPALVLIGGGKGFNREIKTAPADKFWDFLSTDRYTYQPTDKLSFWGSRQGS